MNHYEILGVGESVSSDELKKVYRKLASQHHPDKGGDTARFQEIQAAYNTLSDPDRRQQYDLERKGMGAGPQVRWHSGDMHNVDINEIFRNFGFGFGGMPNQAPPRRNKDLRIEIPIALVTSLEEQKKTISVQTTNGERQTIEVVIPRGVTNGLQIKYAGLGDNLFNTIPRGDLYVHFAVHGDERFVVNNIDLYSSTSVNCLLAVIGGDVFVTGLDGKEFVITIPPGTQPGTRFRIPQQGLYQLNSIQRGDLFFELALTVPQNLESEQLDLIKSLISKL